MICRFTSKLSKKIGIPFRGMGIIENATNPFSDWSANLFRAERTQYIIACNTSSLFSAVFPGAGITDFDKFIKQAFNSIEMMCDEYGFSKEFKHVSDAFNEEIRFSKIGNPSLNGSMVDMVHEAQVQMLELGMDPFMAAYRANEMPMSYLKMAFPWEAFKDLTLPS